MSYRCEDAPACGHELNDCDGSLYGSDESIKAEVERAWATGHGMCDHAEGIYECEVDEAEADDMAERAEEGYCDACLPMHHDVCGQVSGCPCCEAGNGDESGMAYVEDYFGGQE